MPTPTAVLRASLERHNDVFESLLKLIPAQYYIVNDETEDQVWQILLLYYSVLAESNSAGLKIPKAQQEKKGTKTGHQGSL